MNKILQKVEREIETLKNRGKLTKFRNLLLKSLYNFALQTEERLVDLEGRIMDTFYKIEGDFFVETILLPKKELPVYEDQFQPIVKFAKNEYDYFDIDNVYNLVVDRVPILTGEDLSGRRIKGFFKKGEEEYPLEFELQKDNSYYKEVEKLYKVFCANKIQWESIPMAYINSVYKIVIVDGEIKKSAYEEIEFDLGPYKEFAYADYIPCWNVFVQNQWPKVRVRPLKNRVIYEYDFSYCDDKEVMVYNDRVESFLVYKSKDKLKSHGDNKKEDNWIKYTFREVKEREKYEKLLCPIVNNRKKYLSDRQKRQFDDYRMNKFSELKSYLRCFEVLKGIEVLSMKKVDEFSSGSITSTAHFLKNEFDFLGEKEKIEIEICKIGGKGVEVYSFIVDIIASFFPEYEIKGKVVEGDLDD